MSKEKTNFMASLDEWTENNIIFPLFRVARGYDKDSDGTAESDAAMYELDATVKKLVREKVLESYRNGQAAKPPRTQKK